MGSTLHLTCRVYLGTAGPDDFYAKTAVIHWFHDQRLLDPDLENWKNTRIISKQRKSKVGSASDGVTASNSSSEVYKSYIGLTSYLLQPNNLYKYYCIRI